MTILRWLLLWYNKMCRWMAYWFGRMGLWAEHKYQTITEMGKA